MPLGSYSNFKLFSLAGLPWKAGFVLCIDENSSERRQCERQFYVGRKRKYHGKFTLERWRKENT
jgi:hypothetical protein